jgi:preprotein translocase subunit YajC
MPVSFDNFGGFSMTGITFAANGRWKILATGIVLSVLMADAAFADGVAAAAGGPGGLLQQLGPLGQFAPIILIFVVFYFILIRPQHKQAKKHQQFLTDLKRGTKIVTQGGMHGVITDMDGSVLTVEIAKDVRIKINRAAVAGALTKDGAVSVETAEPKSSGG